MCQHLLALVLAVTLIPLGHEGMEHGSLVAADNRASHQESSATILTRPGVQQAGDDGFAPEADGLVPVIVLLSDEVAAGAQFASSLGPRIRVQRIYSRLLHGLALRVDPSGLPALRAQPAVRAVYPDVRVKAALADSVPLVGAPQVWSLLDGQGQHVTGLGERVAIVDSGIDYNLAALGGCLGVGCKVVGGYDFIHDDADPLDDYGHGTHVAGIVAADGLLQGVAPDAELLAYKVLDENGQGYASDVISALERALFDGANVINLSLGAPGSPDDPVSLAAQAAVEAGCIVVAAAGNHGPGAGSAEAPGVAPDVISVAAAGKDDVLADFSGRGPVPDTFALKPDLTAPGVSISSTVPFSGFLSDPSGWRSADGTSMATPHVAGGAALLHQLHGDWTPAEVKAALMSYASDLEIDLFAQGAGRLDLSRAATPELLAVPGSLSFGLPLLEGTQALTLTVRNLTTAAMTVTPTLTLARVTDGASQPLSPTLPVTYASIAPISLTLASGGNRVVTVALDIPLAAVDGHYQGRVQLKARGSTEPASVPLGFSLLSRVTVRVLDEAGQEITGWGHMAALARIPEADFVISNNPLQLPASFTLPSGEYYAQAFGRFGLYDHLLIPGLPAQVPYAVIQQTTVEPHTVQTVTLDLANTRPYWLDATDTEGNPVFVNAWAASFRYRNGDDSWLTRLGQSYVRVLSTDLPSDWPAGFALRLSDTPPGVAFNLALQGASFSPLFRDFVGRHGSSWPAAPSSGHGFPLWGSADKVELLAWDRPGLYAGVTPTFTLAASDVTSRAVRTDLTGLLEAPWLDWEVGAETWLYPPTGARSGLEPIAPGMTRVQSTSGAQHTAYWAGSPTQYRIFHQPTYSVDWSQTRPWDSEPGVFLPDEEGLEPLPQGEGLIILGAGPLFPALAFDNEPRAVVIRHPLYASEARSPVVWGPEAPIYALTLDGASVVSGTLPEYDQVPFAMRRWSDVSPGSYELVISLPVDAASIGPGIIRAGWSLSESPDADPNPPQVLDFALPQRMDPSAAMTASWILSDSSPLALSASVRLGGGPWTPLTVEPVDGSHFLARIEPGGTPTVSLSYTATDASGNWLAWQAGNSASALAQVPVTLTFQLDPPEVTWRQGTATVRIVGSLRGPGAQPLAVGPVWLPLRAGGQFVGYVRDLTGSSGDFHTGDIDFQWTFVPGDLADRPGPLPVSLDFDVGLYTPQTVTCTLNLVPPTYLPLILRGSGS